MPPNFVPESNIEDQDEEKQKPESEAELVFQLKRQSPINNKNIKKKHLFEENGLYNYDDDFEQEKLHNRMNTFSFPNEAEIMTENKRKRKVKTKEDQLM